MFLSVPPLWLSMGDWELWGNYRITFRNSEIRNQIHDQYFLIITLCYCVNIYICTWNGKPKTEWHCHHLPQAIHTYTRDREKVPLIRKNSNSFKFLFLIKSCTEVRVYDTWESGWSEEVTSQEVIISGEVQVPELWARLTLIMASKGNMNEQGTDSNVDPNCELSGSTVCIVHAINNNFNVYLISSLIVYIL